MPEQSNAMRQDQFRLTRRETNRVRGHMRTAIINERDIENSLDVTNSMLQGMIDGQSVWTISQFGIFCRLIGCDMRILVTKNGKCEWYPKDYAYGEAS